MTITETLDNLGPDVLQAATDLEDQTLELRREIHADPEIGNDIPRTQAKILEALTGLDLNITLGESLTSVVADLDTGRPGPTVLLRGDMDALPLQEDNEIDYRSQNEGVMHACGHDTHVAMLVSAAHLLSENRSEFNGRIRFMFQPGEEGHHGAKFMIEEGVLEGVDRAFAIHVITNMPNGVFFAKGGSTMASADRFEVVVHGKGGHASAPHNAVDPIPAAAAMVTGFHTMVGRSVDPALSGLITVGHLTAGTTNNIIPHEAYMQGTIRALDEGTREAIHDGVHRVANGTAAAHGCTCTSTVIPGYPVTINDDAQVDLVSAVSDQVLGGDGFQHLPRPLLGAEDFSYVLQQVPGAMTFLGVCPDDTSPSEAAPNHSNLMTVNETALSRGVALYAGMGMAR